MPFLVAKILEIAIPPLIQAVVNHYEKQDQTPENQAKLDAHKTALEALKPNG